MQLGAVAVSRRRLVVLIAGVQKLGHVVVHLLGLDGNLTLIGVPEQPLSESSFTLPQSLEAIQGEGRADVAGVVNGLALLRLRNPLWSTFRSSSVGLGWT